MAVILDLAGSRDHPDRARAQRDFEVAMRRANASVPAVEPLHATIGDEGQAMYEGLGDALAATLLVRLAVPDPLDVRCGVGAGGYRDVSDAGGVRIQDGPAWWTAREAIETAKATQHGRTPSAHGRIPEQRTWFASDVHPAGTVALVNAYLLGRDHIVGSMREADRRRLLLSLEGRSQAEIAAAEGVSESAVSQSLRRSGGRALAAGLRGLREAVR